MTTRTTPTRSTAAAALLLASLLAALASIVIVTLLAHLATAVGLDSADGSRFPWYTTRAAGVTGYILLSVSTIFGLGISTRLLDRLVGRAAAYVLHECVSWLALVVVGLHVVALLVDTFQPFSLTETLVPFVSSYHRATTGFGIIALYLLIAITISFYIRQWIGQQTWRAFHYASFLLYLLATAHGIYSGAKQDLPWMTWIYLASVLILGFMLAWRVLDGRRSQSARRPAPAARAE